jgi:hypothetical protein
VAIAPSHSVFSAPPSGVRVGGAGRLGTQPAIVRPQLKQIQPQSLLEEKRFHLAGRRRALRKARPPPSDAMTRFRQEVLSILSPIACESHTRRQYAQIRDIELEIIAESFAKNDSSVRVEADFVVGDPAIYGSRPPRAHISDVHRVMEAHNAKQSSEHRALGFEDHRGTSRKSKQEVQHRAATRENRLFRGDDTRVQLQDTFASTMQIVMPQHANTVQVLFGGNLMGAFRSSTSLYMSLNPLSRMDGKDEYDLRTPIEARMCMGCRWVTSSLSYLFPSTVAQLFHSEWMG